MAAETLDLPSVSPSQLLLSQILSNRQTELALPVNEDRWDISLNSIAAENVPAICMQLEINHQPVSLYTGSAFIDLIMPDSLNSQILLKLPKELMLAALENSMQSLLEQLMQGLGIAIKFSDMIANPDKSKRAELAMNIQIAGTQYPIYLESNPIVFELLKLLPTHIQEQSTDIPIWAGLELGQAKLSKEETSALGVGDIVFFHYHVTGQQLIIRVSPDVAFVGEAEDSQITIKHRMDSMEDDQMHHEQEPVDLSDIEVDLLFEVGRQQFSAQEVLSLQPGHVFELDRPIEQPVKVRAGGKLIAECQLVQVNNRLGARITRIVD
ncbi:type III secretion system cytoplasmic ring protein SctQ [Endozoicomonas sp. SCSIO W0465]|uniref:type III secretion system cytoplasmic ring protein SctQ n=1 Tax=Endozoicomonas sp. SCSIO W0465 TaxID=2918516 RepID=UPI0020763DBD|nr:type III secretion system cytoplasmic ring protein SctQ [Endozoicomonas sp. SCSIO W0465]USE34672.1 type III secretion system cytoplasmic ring protein SctQ [Endozoicomonas sp. SCSIO W0465]